LDDGGNLYTKCRGRLPLVAVGRQLSERVQYTRQHITGIIDGRRQILVDLSARRYIDTSVNNYSVPTSDDDDDDVLTLGL